MLFQHNPHIVKNIARFSTQLIDPFIIACISAVLLVLRKKLWFENAVALGSGFLIVRTLKWMIGRSRPKLWYSDELISCRFFSFSPDFQSFPSSHAFAIFTIATTCTIMWPKHKMWIFLGAGILAMSRVILHQHYLSDVVFGAFVGWAVREKIGQVKLARLKL